jgi:predicted aconitase with swiveling domain
MLVPVSMGEATPILAVPANHGSTVIACILGQLWTRGRGSGRILREHISARKLW